MDPVDTSKYYPCDNLQTAAWLTLHDLEFEVRREPPRVRRPESPERHSRVASRADNPPDHVVFLFTDLEKAPRLAEQYSTGTPTGNIRDYNTQLERLKRQIFKRA